LADLLQILVAAAEQQDRFLAAVQGDRGFAHCSVRVQNVGVPIPHRRGRHKARFAALCGFGEHGEICEPVPPFIHQTARDPYRSSGSVGSGGWDAEKRGGWRWSGKPGGETCPRRRGGGGGSGSTCSSWRDSPDCSGGCFISAGSGRASSNTPST